ncbi:MAG: RNA degradosome polyphosphate kinase, partial [Methanoregula sp.]|nr:RNA degradosome polyphosphate kinase [Methanoregula sp.]
MDIERIDLENSTLYINREVSWTRFNRHVLDEARDESHPLLERVKFLAIFANNLDEYFMVRVSGLQRQLEKGVLKSPPDGMTPVQQLEAIRQMLLPDLSTLYDTWHKDILPKLATAGIYIHLYTDLPEPQKEQMRKYFIDEIFPVLTPLVFDSAHPFPFISNRSLNLAIVVRNQNNKDFFARVKVPT